MLFGEGSDNKLLINLTFPALKHKVYGQDANTVQG